MDRHQVEMTGPQDAFARCWSAAGRHISTFGDGIVNSWLRSHLNPPFLEHLSFRLGNQLFFVRVEDEDGLLEVPGNRDGLDLIATGCRGHACLMPMHKQGDIWAPSYPNWGLLDLRTSRPIDPVAMITDEQIEMTDWELQDFAVQVVREPIQSDGFELMAWQGNPDVDPSLWFVGPNGPEWVVVRAVRHPLTKAKIPNDIKQIAQACGQVEQKGNFASVAVMCVNEFTSNDQRLLRGYGLIPNFEGLQKL